MPGTNLNPPVDVTEPPGVVTFTFTVPAAWAGLTTVSFDGLATWTVVPSAVPKATAVAPVRWEPVTATVVPPEVDPEVGVNDVTVGGGAPNLKGGGRCDGATGRGHLDLHVPGPWAGALTVALAALVTWTVVPAAVPKAMTVAPVRWVPVTATAVPPVVGPEVGVNVVMVGAGCTYLNLDDDVTVPLGVVTLMATVPAVPAGLVTTSFVATSDVILVTGFGPKATAVAPLRWVPLMVTTVPPVVGPEVGLNVVIDGEVTEEIDLVADVADPPGPVTLMVTVPAPWGGVVATILWPDVSTVKEVAVVVPNCTLVVPRKWDPAMVTGVPPRVEPTWGRMSRWRAEPPRT